MTEPLINPGMKVAELIERWPALEDVLIAQAPAFRKLKNPVLRRTVARVATLEQAAGVAGISVRDLVMTLRKAAGQPVDQGETGAEAVTVEDEEGTPAWLDEGRITRRVDADALLAAGKSPLALVNQEAGGLAAGDILEVTVAFLPSPLIEALRKQGYRCAVQEAGEGYRLLVTRGQP